MMIYYVVYYNHKDEISQRVSNFAGEDKVDYICEVFDRIGEDVMILSNTKSIINKFLRRKIYQDGNRKILMFASLPKTNRLIHAVDVVYGFCQLSYFLIKNVTNEDIVLVYHSLGYRNLIKKIRRIKRFRYILEVEELFQFFDSANSYKKKENIVFSEPDGFIFSNLILNEKINTSYKPSVIINGIYKKEEDYKVTKDDGIIRVVYAGNLEIQKGVDYVIRAAMKLNGRFELCVIGFGSEQDRKRVKALIEEVNAESSCHVRFDGVLKGKDYLKYLQKCDIGICIQNPRDEFNFYEFPSKIFSYMSNGLNVVVNKLEQIEKSYVNEYVTYAESTSPEDIARAIIHASELNIDATKVMEKLDCKFLNDMKQLLKGV